MVDHAQGKPLDRGRQPAAPSLAGPLVRESEGGVAIPTTQDAGGAPLIDLVGRVFEVNVALKIGIGVLKALKRLHARGIVHFDLRPHWIRTLPDGSETWLTGADITARQSCPTLDSSGFTAGDLHYIAPEQTGMLNQAADLRSDLYACGIVLYQLLTGRLPFHSDSAMELMHCHVARKPVSPSHLRSGIPESVAQVVLKLLEKNPESRYQSAHGAAADLERCLTIGSRGDQAEVFPLGSDDVADRLILTKQLYGRQTELAILVAAFDRVRREGGVELALVAGYSGLGKSSLVGQLLSQVVPLGAQFASGKFDQQKRDIPYAPVTQALTTLIRRILGCTGPELGHWKDSLLTALQPNARLITTLIPDLEKIIGPQPVVAELPGSEEQRRFHSVLARLLGVFASKHSPLVLFLDDLQWLDPATLDLLEHLLTSGEAENLLLVGAYRDNEVPPDHRLRVRLDSIRRAQAKITELTLQSLSLEHVGELLAASLHTSAEAVQALAALVHGKTRGNPFFTLQFISMLSTEGLLAFDHEKSRWEWSLDAIRGKGFTDNVGDLMAERIGKLGPATREALMRLACLGNTASAQTMAIACGCSVAQVETAMEEAVAVELVIAHAGQFSFSHDRVEEGAYSLIPLDERGTLHLEIGRKLIACWGPSIEGDFIFEVVNQFNRAAPAITAPAERTSVAALNLTAGRRARAAAAYDSALGYLAIGDSLMGDDRWVECYDLAFPTAVLQAECEMLTGNLHTADARLAELVPHVRTQSDRAAITCLRIDLFTLLDRSDRSVAVGLEYLASIGLDWSPHPEHAALQQEYAAFHSRLAGRQIETLADLPPLSDSGVRATVEVLTKLQVPALFFDENLHGMVLGRVANLSLEHGNSAGSCFAYCWLAGFVGPHLSDYESAPRFARLSLDLVERPGFDRFKARVYCVFGYLVTPWIAPLATGRSPLLRANQLARASGDLTFVLYTSNHLITLGLAEGRPLATLQDEAERGRELARKVRFGMVADFFSGQLMLIRALRGSVKTAADEDEAQFEWRIQTDPQLAIATCWYWIRQVQARFHLGDLVGASSAASAARKLLWTSTSSFEVAEYHFFAGLTAAALADAGNLVEGSSPADTLREHLRQMTLWAKHCPANFAHRAELLGAELDRLNGDENAAQRKYETAIRLAREQQHVHHEGLTFEVAARFYAKRGFTDFAVTYLHRARECYGRWGADALGLRIQAELVRLSGVNQRAATELSLGQLDLANIIEVAQSVSEEIVLEKLIRTVMTATIEHAGADRVVLLLTRGDEQQVAAEAVTDQDQLNIRIDPAGKLATTLPGSVLRFAARTGEPVALDDASIPHLFSSDEYFRLARPRSILCQPLTVRGKSVGLVYLEHSLVTHAFTPGRIKILEVLASQAAISLENARLFAELQESEERFRQFADKLPEVIWITDLDPERVVYCSPSFERIWGYPVEDLYREPRLWIESIHPDDRTRVLDEFSRWIAGESVSYHDIEFRIRQPNGAVRWVRENSVLTRNEQGKPTRVSGISADITQRKESEEAVQRAHAELTHVARVATMGQMTASIAHEINQPLAGIVTNAAACLRWLANTPPNTERASQAAARIIRDGELAAEVITRLRALFQKTELTRTRLNLNEVILEVLSLVRGDLRRKHIALRFEPMEALPSVPGDRVQLQQVLLNLFRNAIDAMDNAATHPLELVVRTRCLNQTVEVAVTDTGTGLEAGVLAHLYEAFFTTKTGGMGMGLSISRSIIESHGGTLVANNNAGPGATFVFRLPGDIGTRA